MPGRGASIVEGVSGVGAGEAVPVGEVVPVEEEMSMGGVKRVNLEGGCVSSRGAMSREGLGPGGATRVAVEGASWLSTEQWSTAVGGSSQLVVRT